MVEVVGRVVAHPQLLHDPLGAQVGRRREGHELLETQRAEGVSEYRTRSFGGQPLTPVVPRQPPPDLDRRRERRLERHRVEADETDVGTGRIEFDCQQAPSAPLEAGADPVGEAIALRAGERAREVLHHLGVGVERCERCQVAIAPAAKQEPSGAKLCHG